MRYQLKLTRLDKAEPPFMSLLGSMEGPRDLSCRKGFTWPGKASRRSAKVRPTKSGRGKR